MYKVIYHQKRRDNKTELEHIHRRPRSSIWFHELYKIFSLSLLWWLIELNDYHCIRESIRFHHEKVQIKRNVQSTEMAFEQPILVWGRIQKLETRDKVFTLHHVNVYSLLKHPFQVILHANMRKVVIWLIYFDNQKRVTLYRLFNTYKRYKI